MPSSLCSVDTTWDRYVRTGQLPSTIAPAAFSVARLLIAVHDFERRDEKAPTAKGSLGRSPFSHDLVGDTQRLAPDATPSYRQANMALHYHYLPLAPLTNLCARRKPNLGHS
ncbi:hypothetical protein F01_570014 [Burkholderia cenocepacia]|nr:hypothetical protein F01_570014 [Burkholderia cenocepacia]